VVLGCARSRSILAWADETSRRSEEWNDSWDCTIVQEDEEDVPEEVLYERGRELAIRVQNELGTDG
jgi:hypothetical protein